MKKDQEGYDLHVLICTNEKLNGGGCGPKGSKLIVDELKAWTKSDAFRQKLGLSRRIRVNQSGCLGRCDEGIICVAYPKGEWVVEAKPSDLPAIQEWISSLMNEGSSK